METTTTFNPESANRYWAELASQVVVRTGGDWMPVGWLYVPYTGNRQVSGMILQPLAGGLDVEIETPQQYEQFLTKEGYTNA